MRVSTESWFSRIGGAIKGIVVGAVLFVLAFPLLFWNEGRAVQVAKGLAEGAGAVISLASPDVDPANEGQFVHLTGKAETTEQLTDEKFGVSETGIRLTRHVEMYQWEESSETETKKNLGGSKTTTETFSYEMVWSDSLIDSGSFEEGGHQNPSVMPFSKLEHQSTDVKVGSFKVPDSLISKISKPQPVSISTDSLPEDLAGMAHVVNDGPNGSDRFYMANANSAQGGASLSAEPQIGDVRVWFSMTPVTDVSIMSKQAGDSFEPFETSVGTNLHMLTTGVASAESMIAAAEAANTALTWLIRFAGAMMMFGGIALVLRPLAVIGDVVPIFGSIVGFGTTAVAALVAASLSLITISIAWVFYRPLIGIPLLLLGVGLGAFLVMRMKKTDSGGVANPDLMQPATDLPR